MAQDQTFVAGTGNIFVAPTSTARPTNLKTPGGAWVNVGDTDASNPFSFTFNGGNSTTLGTWQNQSKRVTHDALTIDVNFTLLNWTLASLAMYFGGNGATVAGRYQVPLAPTETQYALLIVAQDGLEEVAIYAPSTSIYRNGDIATSVTGFATLPVRATILGVTGNTFLFEIDPKTDLDVATLANSPASTSGAAASTVQLTVTATLQDSTTRDVTSLATYTSSDNTKATVSSSGLITRVATGSATITSAYGEKTANTAVTIT